MTPEQLRGSILQYAVQGKIVEQRQEEGTAADFLNKITEVKSEKIKKGEAKKSKTLTPIEDSDKLFDIPETWKWIKLGEIATLITKGTTPRGGNVAYLDKGIGFLRAENVVGLDRLDKDNLKYIDEDTHNGFLKRSIIETNDILITIAGTLGRTGLVRQEDLPLNANQAVSMVRLAAPEYLDLQYLIYVLNSPDIQKYLTQQKKTTAIPNLTLEIIENCVCPFPPLQEQHRIVAKIEEMLPYVDRYAVAYEKLEQFNAKFPEDMKKSILQYAIQGKLVEQRPEEGTAEDLYKAIQEEKQKRIKEGKIKKEKPLAEITEDEIPFDIPDSWKWVKLGDCTSYAQSKEKISPPEITNDMWSLDLEDIQKETGTILVKTLASERKISGDKVKFRKGQVLYSKLRPYLKKILVAPDDGICTPELVPFNVYGIDANYISYVLKSPHVDYIINTATYGVKMPRVGTDTMINLLIPLPPLEEQHRIVAKIEELLPYCDRLVK